MSRTGRAGGRPASCPSSVSLERASRTPGSNTVSRGTRRIEYTDRDAPFRARVPPPHQLAADALSTISFRETSRPVSLRRSTHSAASCAGEGAAWRERSLPGWVWLDANNRQLHGEPPLRRIITRISANPRECVVFEKSLEQAGGRVAGSHLALLEPDAGSILRDQEFLHDASDQPLPRLLN